MKQAHARSARPRDQKRSAVASRQDAPAGGGTDSRVVTRIVGIGASAGGLDGFKKFFSGMPAESGLGFVLIQHLDPTRESLTAELVGTYTSMPVVQAEHGMHVEANRVYVIPPTLRSSQPKRN
jgi:two-component system, chemotaxis family, CheB/CheR fusion protein